MNKSAVIEALRPVQDVVEAAPTGMSSVEGTPVIEQPTAEQKPEPHIPRRNQLGIVPQGLTKDGVSDTPEGEAEEKVSDLSSKAGTVFHGVARLALAEVGEIREEARFVLGGLRRVLLERYLEKRHKHSPALYRGWVRKSSEMMPELQEILLPAPGYKAQVVPEASLLVGKKHKKAAAKLTSVLEAEQLDGDGTPGPFEKLMMAAPSFQLQGRRSGKFARQLRELPESVPLSRTAIRRLTRQARTHMFIKGGNLIAPPTSRPDILEFVYKEGDTGAQQAAEALSNVFRQNIGFNPDRLYREEVTYTDRDDRTGEERQIPITALEAVHWGVSLIASGRITPCVLDIKLQTHIGKKWETLNQLWEENNNNLAKIFSSANLHSENPKYADWQEHWNDMERNVAATAYSVMAFFRMAEREFRNRYPREREPLVKWEKLAKRMRAGIVLVDFDISKHGEPPEPNLDELPLGYQTTPPIEQAGVPKDVSMMLRPIEPYRLQKRLGGREREMRRQYVSHVLAKAATRATMAKAA